MTNEEKFKNVLVQIGHGITDLDIKMVKLIIDNNDENHKIACKDIHEELKPLGKLITTFIKNSMN